MFTSVEKFIDTWKQEMQWTHNVLAGLTDESLSQSVGPDGRTLGRLAWHVTQTVPEMMNKTGLAVKGPDEHEAPPSSAAKIASAYDGAAASLLEEVQSKWKDETLSEVDEMYGEKWKRGETGLGEVGNASSGSLMKSRIVFLTALLLLVAATLEAHDMFLRPDNFFVRPESRTLIRALNGTFSSSENAVTRDRLRDISVVGPAGWSHLDTTAWDATSDTTTARLGVQIGGAGTYVVGASTRPREITLEAKDFNTYLADDGIPDVLAARRRSGELGKKATERYSKHIKALLQAGDKRSQGFDTVLGYPAELIPLNNPYLPRTGGWLRVRALVDGKPVANQLVVAGGRKPGGARLVERRVRTDANGVARIRVADKGQWYVKFINMVGFEGAATAGSPVPDYESKWATLTFEIR